MTDRSRHLCEIACRYAAENTHPGMVAAYVGGSVGRGDADEYSDIDLMIYYSKVPPGGTRAINTVVQGETLQVHHHQLPTREDVRRDPWGFRFLIDACGVHDPAGAFASLKQDSTRYLRSEEGRQRILSVASGQIASRCDRSKSALEEGKACTAGMAAMTAVAEAAMLYGYEKHALTSTGNVLANMCDEEDLVEQIVSASPVPRTAADEELDLRIEGVKAYRDDLRRRTGMVFETDELQHELVERKVRRLRDRGEITHAAHELYHQTCWLVRLAAKGSLESHLDSLSPEISESLQSVGFRSVGQDSITRLLDASTRLVSLAGGALEHIAEDPEHSGRHNEATSESRRS